MYVKGFELDNVFNNEFSPEELQRVINKLKQNKACGPDAIVNEVIKCSGFHEILLKLYQSCYNTGIVPAVWQNAIIKPIPKGAEMDPLLPLNYRRISLISCVSKV